MIMDYREIKKHLRSYLRTAYNDERLATLLAHARDEKLSFYSCCCFIGLPTAKHALKGYIGSGYLTEPHYQTAKGSYGADMAEYAYCQIGWKLARTHASEEAARRRFLIPLVRAEMKRRELLRKEAQMDLPLAYADEVTVSL
jgi:hypothetical protein